MRPPNSAVHHPHPTTPTFSSNSTGFMTRQATDQKSNHTKASIPLHCNGMVAFLICCLPRHKTSRIAGEGGGGWVGVVDKSAGFGKNFRACSRMFTPSAYSYATRQRVVLASPVTAGSKLLLLLLFPHFPKYRQS